MLTKIQYNPVTGCTTNYYSTHTHTVLWPSGLWTRVSWYQKGKTNLNFTEEETVSASGTSWAICKLHLAPDRWPWQHPTTQFLQAGCPSCHPTNSVKALKAQNNTTAEQSIWLLTTFTAHYTNYGKLVSLSGLAFSFILISNDLLAIYYTLPLESNPHVQKIPLMKAGLSLSRRQVLHANGLPGMSYGCKFIKSCLWGCQKLVTKTLT